MTWLVYAGLLAFSGAGIHITGKLAAKSVHGDLVILIATTVGFITSAAFVLVKRGVPDFSSIQANGWVFSIGLGVFITIAHIVMLYMYNLHAPISIAMPLVRLASIIIVVGFGLLLFGESLKPINCLGLFLGALSMYFLAR